VRVGIVASMPQATRRVSGAPFLVHVLALRGCSAIVPVGVVDVLRKTSELAALPGRRVRRVEVKLVASGSSRDIECAGGMRLRCTARLPEVRRSDLVVVPAVDPDIAAQIALNAVVVPWLRRMFERGADVASACTGAFLLGEAGILDGRVATTHWAFQELFARRFPRVQLLPQAILVDQGRVVTAGGATSFLNLALHLAERIFGAEVARTASKMFLIDVNKAPQGAYAMFSSQKLHADGAVLQAQSLIEQRLERTPSVDELARAVALSPRTFARRFRQATGNSPLEYIQRVKIEAAKRALEGGDLVSSVAAAVGYGDPAAFRKRFSHQTGLTPSDYRARYGPTSMPSTVTLRRSRRRHRRQSP
jgi:transcriptional regulator GlxA family with amidase domain